MCASFLASKTVCPRFVAAQYLNCWSSICAPEAVHAHRAAGAWPARRDRYGSWFRDWLDLGERVNSQQIAAARIAYDRCTGQLNGLFSSSEGGIDVLICPAMPSPPDTGAGPAVIAATSCSSSCRRNQWLLVTVAYLWIPDSCIGVSLTYHSLGWRA